MKNTQKIAKINKNHKQTKKKEEEEDNELRTMESGWL